MISENKENFPLVSVVIPCLNRANFLVPTIESVLNQDYSNIECIVVDGGSTDGTIDILKSYGDRIFWISEPDRGHADAINKGWKRSRGQILAWLNADDIWAIPDAVSQVVDYFKNHPDVDVVYGDCGTIDADGKVVKITSYGEWDLEYAVEYCTHILPQPAAFMRRSILEKVNWLDINFIQKKDHELWLRIGLVGKIKHLPKVLAYGRNIRGLSYDIKTAAPACIQVTRKFFTLPNIPESIKKKKRRAMSNSYLKAADYAYSCGPYWFLIGRYVIQALAVDPLNIINVIRRLKRVLKSKLKKRKE